MKNKFFIIAIAAVLLTAAVVIYFSIQVKKQSSPAISVINFAECVAAGYPVMESYPRQCRTPEGNVFTEDIGNELEKHDLIRVSSPRPNEIIQGPVIVQGEARGYWFFEASFPIRVYDAEGNELGVGIAQAEGEWMTEEFVPFRAQVSFRTPQTTTGTLVLERDNPSGLPEYDDSLIMPIRFSLEPSCFITGCSRQICSDREVVTTCEFRPEYACYQNAVCERQMSGECGWRETKELRQCLENTR